MSVHSFDADVAADVGLAAAVIYKNIQFWLAKNRVNGRHEYEGHTWTYNSAEAFSKLFSYLSAPQIRRALSKLTKAGYIGTGNFNTTGYDRTLWYCDLRFVDLTKPLNEKNEAVKPIPDSNTDSNTDIKNTQKDEEFKLTSPKSKSDPDVIFDKLWPKIYGLAPKEKKAHFSKKLSRTRFVKIASRKKDPISATRLANAMMWFYHDESQTKDGRKYMKAPQYVLQDELFEAFLTLGAFSQKKAAGATIDDLWAQRGRMYAVDRIWDHQWFDGPSHRVPQEFHKHFPKEDWGKLGWSK